MAPQQGNAREGDRREHAQGEQVDERLREDRARDHRQQAPVGPLEATSEHDHARGLADATGEQGGGHHADHRRAHDRTPRDVRRRKRSAECLVPGERAHEQRKPHQDERHRDPSRRGSDERMPDMPQPELRKREGHAARKRRSSSARENPCR